MEAVVAIALAGNILQFVQLGLQVVSKASEFKRSSDGALNEHSDLELVVKDLDARLDPLQSCEAGADPVLDALVKRSRQLGIELRGELLKVKAKGGRWSTYRQALSAVWNKSAIEDAEKNLHRMREEIGFHLQTVTQQDVSTLLSESTRVNKQTAQGIQCVQEELSVLLSQQTNGLAGQSKLLIEIRELRKLHSRLSDLLPETQIRDASDDSSRVKDISDKIMQTLRFRGMDDRQGLIARTYEDTFRWLLEDAEQAPGSHVTATWSVDDAETWPMDDPVSLARALEPFCGPFGQVTTESKDSRFLMRQRLRQWLAGEESSMFWIWGKPGCGKSTLMKLLAEDSAMRQRLDDLLRVWSTESDLITARLFFFRPGTTLQKSPCGFYRTLIYQILKQRPASVNMLLSGEEQADIMMRASDHVNFEESMWTLPELRKAFQSWRKQDQSKLFIMVDGIDEIDSPAGDVADLLCDIIKTGNVKILTAGRWTPEFRIAFKPDNTFGLHEATRQDIIRYSIGRLNTPVVTEILDNIKQMRVLLLGIVMAAEGVFQWVKIVTDSLVRGAIRFETFQQLYQRLHEYPKDLDDLYRFLYNQIEPRYLPDASFWILATQAADSVYNHKLSKFAESRFYVPTVFNYTHEYVTPFDPGMLYYADAFNLNDNTSLVRLHSGDAFKDVPPSKDIKEFIGRRIQSQCPQFFSIGKDQITFAHRTVLDFISQETIAAELKANSKPGRHPLLWLFATQLGRRSPCLLYLWKLGDALASLDVGVADRYMELLRPIYESVDDNYESTSQTAMAPTHHGILDGLDETAIMGDVFKSNDPLLQLLAITKTNGDILMRLFRLRGTSGTDREATLVKRWWNYRTTEWYGPEAGFYCMLDVCSLSWFSDTTLPENSHAMDVLFQWLRQGLAIVIRPHLARSVRQEERFQAALFILHLTGTTRLVFLLLGARLAQHVEISKYKTTFKALCERYIDEFASLASLFYFPRWRPLRGQKFDLENRVTACIIDLSIMRETLAVGDENARHYEFIAKRPLSPWEELGPYIATYIFDE